MNTGMLKVKVEFYATMRDVFQKKERRIELVGPAADIRAVINIVCGTYQQRNRIFEQDGKIRSDVNIFKNGRHINYLNGIETEVEEGDTIAIFPIVRGG